MLFSQTSALVKATVTQLSNVPVGFPPPPSRCASAIAVWLLRVWCSRNVPDIDVKLPAKWFHIRASCVIELGAVRYPALSEETTTLTVSPLVWDPLKCMPYASCLVRSCLSPTTHVMVCSRKVFIYFFSFYLRWDSCCLLSLGMMLTWML